MHLGKEAMKATIATSKGGQLCKYAISGPTLLGRSPKSNIRLPDPAVSGRHCAIFYDENRGWVIRDLGSSNGTFVNGLRAEGDMILSDGDMILLGGSSFTFSCEAPVEDLSDSRLEENLEDRIQSQVSPAEQTLFLPESRIRDESVLRTDYEKLRVTYELQTDIGLEINIDRILKKILKRTYQFLNCDRGVILLADSDGKLRPKVFKGRNKDDRPSVSRTLIRHITKSKQGVLSLDALADERFNMAESLVIQGVRSTMGVPILHHDELLGVILVDSSTATNAYTQKDLNLLSNIANRSAQFIKISQMARKIETDAVTRARFQRLLSPNLAELVVSGKLEVKKGGQSLVATVLFVDIRGFTAMSENMKAADLLKMLNSFFEVMVDCVFGQEGTVDKYMGDGLMVIWGAPVFMKDHAARAVRSAIDMRGRLEEFNRARAAEGFRPLKIGIGINTGELVAGYMGSTRTMSYSVIGDTVNTASRLCSAAKAGQIVISESTLGHLGGAFRVEPLKPIQAKGKQEPVTAYNVVG